MSERLVTLKGGPHDGLQVYARLGMSIVIDLGEDRIARYRMGRDKSTYTFRGYDTIIARLPAPSSLPTITTTPDTQT